MIVRWTSTKGVSLGFRLMPMFAASAASAAAAVLAHARVTLVACELQALGSHYKYCFA